MDTGNFQLIRGRIYGGALIFVVKIKGLYLKNSQVLQKLALAQLLKQLVLFSTLASCYRELSAHLMEGSLGELLFALPQ